MDHVFKVITTLLAFATVGSFVAAGIIIAFIMQMPWWKLHAYLKKHYPQRWEEITTIGRLIGPGARNGPRTIRYIYDDREIDDPSILKLKLTLRKLWSIALKLFIASFGCILLVIIIDFVAAALGVKGM
ncbi:MAG: hypothetical protein ABFD64_13500 [Armatimonadota bacterium]